MARKRGLPRIRTCIECTSVEEVRADNPSDRCRSCAARAAGARGLVTIKARAAAHPTVWRHRTVAVWLDRHCQQCGGGFRIRACTLSGRTNASGRFCSQRCYHLSMATGISTPGRGSRWRAVARAAIRRVPFCAMCPTFRRLDVHHVVPYRLTCDNGSSNLVPLCRTHHAVVEGVTRDVLATGLPLVVAKLALRSMLLEAQQVGAAMILGAANG